MTNRPDRVILHCAATPDSRESKFSSADVDRWHKERGWKGIGYHFYIDRSGKIGDLGRDISEKGAHTIGQNNNSIGICYEGSYFPSLAQIDTLFNLYRKIKAENHIDIDQWYGHNDFADKDCPGFSIEEFKILVRKLA